MNLAISGLLLREANMVVCEESMTVDAGSVSTASCFKMNSLENSFASPKYRSESAVSYHLYVYVYVIYELQRTCTVCLNILSSVMEFGSWNNVM